MWFEVYTLKKDMTIIAFWRWERSYDFKIQTTNEIIESKDK